MATKDVKPGSDGTSLQWAIEPTSPTTHYDKVDDNSGGAPRAPSTTNDDGDTTYVYRGLSADNYLPIFKLNSDTTVGTQVNLTGSYSLSSEELARPGGGNWTIENIYEMEFGVRNSTSGTVTDYYIPLSSDVDDIPAGATINKVTHYAVGRKTGGKAGQARVTQVFIEVDYTENVTITPAAASCVLSTTDPTVLPLVITPTAASCILSTTDPYLPAYQFGVPQSLECDYQTTPATNVSELPIFTAVFEANDLTDYQAREMQIQVSTDNTFSSGGLVYDSDWYNITDLNDGERSQKVVYGTNDADEALLSSHPPDDKYYWRCRFRNVWRVTPTVVIYYSPWSDDSSLNPAEFSGINRPWANNNYAFRRKIVTDTDHTYEIPTNTVLEYSLKTGERQTAATDGAFNEAIQASGGFQIDAFGEKLFIVYLGEQDPTDTAAQVEGEYTIKIIQSNDGGDTWSASTQIALSGTNFDSHFFPTMVIDKSGYIHIMYGAHGGSFQYTKSTYPEDITTWETPTTITNWQGTYPVGFMIPTKGQAAYGRIFWTCRDSTDAKNIMIYSDDGGDTWSSVYTFGEITDSNNSRYYAYGWRYDTTNQRLWHCCTKEYVTGNVGQGIWCFYSDLDETDSLSANVGFNIWREADGTLAGYTQPADSASSSIDLINSNALFLASTDNTEIFVETLELDKLGNPIVFWEQHDESGSPTVDTFLMCATWNGSSWTKHYISEQINRMLRVRRSSISIGRDKDNRIVGLMPVGPNTWNHFLPTSDVDDTDVTPSTSGSNFPMVDDKPSEHDGASTYLTLTSGTGIASFGSTNTMPTDPAVQRISEVEISAIMKTPTASNSSIKLYIAQTSLEDEATGRVVSGSADWTEYTDNWATNPWTSSAWTVSDVESLEFGVKCVSGEDLQVTRIFMRVKYSDQFDDEWGSSELIEIVSSDDGQTWTQTRKVSLNSAVGVPIMNNASRLIDDRLHFIWTSGYDIFYFTDNKFGLVRPDGMDLKIYYDETEIHRVLDYTNLNESKIYFKTQAAIPANRRAGANDYYIYYGYKNETTIPLSDPQNVFRMFQNFETYDDNENLNGKDGWTTTGTVIAYASPPSHANKTGAGELSGEMGASSSYQKTLGTNEANVLIEALVWMEGGGPDLYMEVEDSGSTFGAGLNLASVDRAVYHIDSTWTDSGLGADKASYNRLKIAVTSSGCSAWWNDNLIVATPSGSITAVDILRFVADSQSFIDFIRVSSTWYPTADPVVSDQGEERRGFSAGYAIQGIGGFPFTADWHIDGLFHVPGSVSLVTSTTNPTVIQSSVTITPSAASCVLSTTDPTIVMTSITVTPAAAGCVLSTTAPTVVQGSISLTPSAVSLIASSTDPAVILGSITLTPAAVSVILSSTDPVVLGGDEVITPAAVSCILSTTAPTVVLGSISLTPTASSTILSTTDPTVQLGSVTVTPAAASCILSTTDPVVVQDSITITPTAASTILSTTNPTTILGSITLTPSAASGILSTTDPTLVFGSVTVTPNAASCVLSTTDPTVLGGDVIITPSAVSCVLSTTAPVVVQDSLSLTPSAVACVVSTTNPGVVLGNLTITPTATSVILSVTQPTIVMDSITATPSAVSVILSTTDPTTLQGSLSLTPTAASFVVSTTDPAIILDSITITPTALGVILSTTDPMVQITTLVVDITGVRVIDIDAEDRNIIVASEDRGIIISEEDRSLLIT